MIEFNRPMLAASLLKAGEPHTDDFIYKKMKTLKYPVIATLKKDGIRGIKLGDLASRTLKKIPNVSLQERSKKLPYGLDMELWNPDLPYDQVESIVMSKQHTESDKIQFHILDWFPWKGGHIPYEERLNIAAFECCHIHDAILTPFKITCVNAYYLMNYFLEVEREQGEGICFRLPDSPYKQGRSTLREQYLVKLARFTRDECTIIGFEEQMFNTNDKTTNFVGLAKRSSSCAGLVGKGVLGAFIVRYKGGQEGRIGTGVGLTDAKRAEIWDNQDKWLGKTIVYKSKAHGVKLKPRSPIFVGERKDIDIV